MKRLMLCLLCALLLACLPVAAQEQQVLYDQVTLAQAAEDDVLSARWYDQRYNQNSAFSLSWSQDREMLYLHCLVQDVDAEVSQDGYPSQRMHFAFTVAPYDEQTGVPTVVKGGKTYEVYAGYRIYLSQEGTMVDDFSQQINASPKATAVYDAQARTMTYDVALPLKDLGIDPAQQPDLALSAVVALEHYNNNLSGSVNGSNRWYVGSGAAFCGGPDNPAHQDQCLRLTLADPSTLSETVGKQNVDVPIAEEPEYRYITAHAPVAVPLLIILGSVLVVMGCAAAVTITLVKERNEREEQ